MYIVSMCDIEIMEFTFSDKKFPSKEPPNTASCD